MGSDNGLLTDGCEGGMTEPNTENGWLPLGVGVSLRVPLKDIKVREDLPTRCCEFCSIVFILCTENGETYIPLGAVNFLLYIVVFISYTENGASYL